MKNVFFILLIFILAGCSSSNRSGQDFYTWIDESGNIRSEQRAQHADEQNQGDSTSQPKIDDSLYISSDEIERKLEGTKLYSWVDQNGNQQIHENALLDSKESSAKISRKKTHKEFIGYREGNVFLFSELKGREIKLNDYYRFNKDKQQDYLLIELDIPINRVQLSSYIIESKVALPNIIQLNSNYIQSFEVMDIWGEIHEESWYQYGFVLGDFVLDSSTQYILITPSFDTKPLEFNETLIKKTDLGVISFRPAY